MERIAIIGIGCRFPGAENPDRFWQLLQDEVDAVTEVPRDRWDIDAFYDPQPGRPGKMNTRCGGFLSEVDQFDPQFFGIAPREAVYMDPQQRLLLEVAWEALEHAGQVPEALARSQTGVFVGISGNDYQQVLKGSGGNQDIDAYLGTGNAFSIAANRLSYFFDFRGPSLAIDTACSSSLVAVHLACQSLRSGESDLALTGGVNLLLRPEVTMIFSQARMMAPDGRCKTFDARADGYVRSEGCGIVVLKRLTDALRDGDRILATIRGSATNQDGRSNGITAPNGPAQEAVIQRALSAAKVAPADISYVELHGTGTTLGDPIEAEALGHVLMQDRAMENRCAVGSVKTNIGHLEAAAGIAGIIKVALALQHRQIPASLHFQSPNPYIPLEELPIKVQTALAPWLGESLLAGVSSFGFGGTNAHVILEAVSETTVVPQPAQGPDQHAQLFPLSAKTPEALQSLAQSYQTFLAQQEKSPSLWELCYGASVRRSHHDHRVSLIFSSFSELNLQLDALGRGKLPMGAVAGQRKGNRKAKLAFVFPGQGPQWWAMGRALWQQEPVFCSVLKQCDTLLRSYTRWSLVEELLAAESQSRLDQTEIAQPALFALQVALVALWRSWGIEPSAVVGHSLGEVAAAYVAGVLSLADAIRVVYHRSRLMQQGTGHGKMAAVERSPSEIAPLIAPYGERLAIAAINSPTSVVLSGESTALEEVLAHLQQQETSAKLLPVNYAFHSPQMNPFQNDLVAALEDLQPQLPGIRLYSTVTGQPIQDDAMNAQHWGKNIREPVRFAETITQLIAEKFTLFIEISPHPVLAGYITQCLRNADRIGVVLPSLRRQTAERETMLSTLGALYCHGYPVQWQKLYPQGGRWVPLPTYPWQRSRYWADDLLGTKTVQTRQSQTDSEPSQDQATTSKPIAEISWGVSRSDLVAAEPSDRPQLIVSFYTDLLAKVMGVSDTHIETPLLSLGLDSIMGMELYHHMESALGVVLPLEEFPGLTASRFTTLVLQQLDSSSAPDESSAQSSPVSAVTARAATTVPGKIAHGHGVSSNSEKSWIVCFQPQVAAKFRLFCFNYAGAGASIFRSWADELPPEIEVCAIQLPGREDRLGETPFTRMNPLIQALLPSLLSKLEIPYAFFGHSMGALVAFETVRALRKEGCPVPFHFWASASRAPQLPDLNLPIHRLPEPHFLEALRQLKGTPEGVLENADLMKLLSPTIRADLAIFENYIYAAQDKLPFPITAFGGQEDSVVQPETLAGWQDQTTGLFQLQMFPSDHFFIHRERAAVLQAITAELAQPLSITS